MVIIANPAPVVPDSDHRIAKITLVYSNVRQNRRFLGALSVAAAALLLQLTTTGNVLAQPVTARPAPTQGAAALLAGVRSWGYQLQGVVPARIAGSNYDLVVVDYSADGTAAGRFSPAQVETMQRTADGRHRLVLAYLSIGEAEDYRAYWNADWAERPPGWLGAENPDWEGNYAVRYWDPAWQQLIFGGPAAYLDAIIAAGYDGVYLDRIDAFDVAQAGTTRSGRMSAMADFVAALARYAREKVPGFIVFGQNGEELLADVTYSAAIDGVGKEDLFFGINGDGVTNARSDIRASLDPLQKFMRTGKPVLLVEYLTDPEQITFAHQQATAMGSPLFIAGRELDDVRSR